MNNSKYMQWWRIICLSVLIWPLFCLGANSLGTDIDGHKIEVATWGRAINGIQLGYGFDHQEMSNPKSEKVTFEFQIRNDSSSKIAVVETAEHRGIHFFVTHGGVESELLSSKHKYGLQNNFGFAFSKETLHIYFSLSKMELGEFTSSATVARITIHSVQDNAANSITPFNVEVPFKGSD